LSLAGKGPIGKARDRPDLARKVITRARQEGLWSTYQVVRNLLDSPIPLGYSCAGEVIAVGSEATEFRVGERVACAGLNFANHAEVDYIPRNLAVKMPEGLSYDDACFVAVGAVAMQGVRLARIELGSTIVVIGLGMVGQICVQLARCAGATVIAADPDTGKHELATRLGTSRVVSGSSDLVEAVNELTGGQGADAVLVCAASSSSRPLEDAAEVARLKGRVVVIGDVGMNLERRTYFEKELELVVSRSYGPGRYDAAYEVHGVDYPLPYVRWTERRNMQAFLEVLARADAQVGPLVTHRSPIEDAETAYEIVAGKRKEPAVAIVLEYDDLAPKPTSVPLSARRPVSPREEIRLGVIGAGQFAKGLLLPAFKRQKSVRFQSFCTASGLTSRDVAERYGAATCTSDPAEVIHDDSVDALIVATRHDQHARLATEALRAGKAVFVEKPLALNVESLHELCQTVQETGSPRLMVGFNRRFAPLARRVREHFTASCEPLSVQYRVNAGALPADSWVFDPVHGGGRIIGEVCHFVDTICYLTQSRPQKIFAEALAGEGERELDRQNVIVTLRMESGAIGTIHYLANGDPSLPKERIEIFGGQRIALLDNYRSLSLHARNRRRRSRLLNQSKGFAEEVGAFVDAIETGGPMPIDFETLVAVTQTTFLIHRSLSSGEPVAYEPPKA
jgi:predicted dehydrogenase